MRDVRKNMANLLFKCDSDIEQIKMLLLMFSLKSYLGSWVWPMLCKQEDSQDQHRKLNMVTWMTTTIVLWRNGGEGTSRFASTQWEAISRDGAGHQMSAPDLCLQGYVHVDTSTQIAHRHYTYCLNFTDSKQEEWGTLPCVPMSLLIKSFCEKEADSLENWNLVKLPSNTCEPV